MKTIVNAVLVATKWGYAINFQGDLTFLIYSGNRNELEIGKEYVCEIYYRLMYPKDPERQNMNWSFIESSYLDQIKNHPDFKSHKLKIEKVQPHFFIKT